MASPMIVRPQVASASADLRATRANKNEPSSIPAKDANASEQFENALESATKEVAAKAATSEKATEAAEKTQQLAQQVEEKTKKQTSPEAAGQAQQVQQTIIQNQPLTAQNKSVTGENSQNKKELTATTQSSAPTPNKAPQKPSQTLIQQQPQVQAQATQKFTQQMAQAAFAQDAATAKGLELTSGARSEVQDGINAPHTEGTEFHIPSGLGLQEMKFEQGMSGESGKTAVSSKQTSQAAMKPTAVSSTLSTDDYLNLRNFGAGTAKKSSAKLTLNPNELGTKGSATDSATALSATMLNKNHGAQQPLATIDAPVTTGHMQKTILSHDAVHQMTNQLSAMNLAKQDGEIKIRLKPDHLGELNLSVRNHGQQISIRIQAQDSDSKQIIESSLNSLRDSLSQHNLTVTRMEVTQAPTAPQAAAQDSTQMQMDLGQFQQQQSDTAFQQQQHQESMANRNYWREEESNNVRAAAPSIGAARARQSARSTEGLDLIA